MKIFPPAIAAAPKENFGEDRAGPGLKLFVFGSKNSVVAVGSVWAYPPRTRTRPSGSETAEKSSLTVLIEPTGLKVPVLGLKTSAVATAPPSTYPPAIRTRPSGRLAATGAYRPSLMVPATRLKLFVFGSKISAVSRLPSAGL